MSEKSKGFCKYCRKEYTKGGMLRHLDTCKKEKKVLKKKIKEVSRGIFKYLFQTNMIKIIG